MSLDDIAADFDGVAALEFLWHAVLLLDRRHVLGFDNGYLEAVGA